MWAWVRPLLPVTATIAVLAVVNVLNNILAPWLYVPTCVAATAALLLLARRFGSTWSDLGLGRGTFARGSRWAGVEIVLVAVVYVVALALPLTRWVFTDARASDLAASAVTGAVLVRVPLATVLLEEVGFRGVLWAQVSRLGGPAWATAVSSVLFAIWHVVPATRLGQANAVAGQVAAGIGDRWTVVGAMLAAGLAGVVLCELRRRSGSLLAPMGLHLATNALAYLAAFASPHLFG